MIRGALTAAMTTSIALTVLEAPTRAHTTSDGGLSNEGLRGHFHVPQHIREPARPLRSSYAAGKDPHIQPRNLSAHASGTTTIRAANLPSLAEKPRTQSSSRKRATSKYRRRPTVRSEVIFP